MELANTTCKCALVTAKAVTNQHLAGNRGGAGKISGVYRGDRLEAVCKSIVAQFGHMNSE